MGQVERAPNQSWFGAPIQGATGKIERPTDEARIREILMSPDQYPSPVRPVGSRHSMTECISARGRGGAERWGTLVDMTGLVTLRADHPRAPGKSLHIDRDAQGVTVTVPAGRTFIDVARELRKDPYNLAFRINTELGTLTIGAAACGATKDSSFPGEYGQVCSDVVGMRVILPNGAMRDYRADNPDDEKVLAALRCSYGLFGIVTEVTFRVEPHQAISIRHEKCKVKDFSRQSARWLDERNAVFLYLFPYDDDEQFVAELRKKPVPGTVRPDSSTRLRVRNELWSAGLHDFARAAGAVPSGARDATYGALDFFVEKFFKPLQLDCVSPVDQIVPFDPEDTGHRFTFSMWAFPAQRFGRVLPEYYEFCRARKATFRAGLPHVSYYIAGDASSLLSYSRRGPVWTLDPISPDAEARKPGWETFLRDFNEFCSARGGVPLLNQTPFLEHQHLERAFGDQLQAFEALRREFDPQNRMLNDYFARLLNP
jgi:hypothetical protein